jgi:O-antigen ligase
MIIVNTDSGYIGMAAAFCAVAYIVAKNTGSFYKVLLLAGTFLLSPRFVNFIYRSLGGKTKPLSDMAVLLGESEILFAAALILLIAAVGISRVKITKTASIIIRITVVLFALLIVIGISGAIIYYTVFDTTTQLGFLENYLRFSDKWATERGEIWMMTMDSYSDLPFLKKLFGCGPDTLLLLLSENYNDRMLVTGYVDNAHNEFMNYLVNHGIVGLGFYLAMIYVALKKCVARVGQSIVHGGLFAVVISYACQSVVNISQPLTTPFYFIILFMCCCDMAVRPEKENKIS